MSGFRFRLERVLTLRETQLSMEESALAQLHGELNKLEGALIDLESRQKRETDLLHGSPRLRGSDLAGFATARKWAQQEHKRLQDSLASCHRSIEIRKASLMEAQRKVRLLERLKERRAAAWTHEQNRVLEELAGDSAVGSWRRDASRDSRNC